MPDNVLRLAAAGIACCAALGFALGLNGAGPRPRLPGEPLAVSDAPEASKLDTRPISSEEIAPAAPEKTEEKKEEEAAPQVAAAPPQKLVLPPPEVTPPPDRVGELLETAPPPAEDEPPH